MIGRFRGRVRVLLALYRPVQGLLAAYVGFVVVGAVIEGLVLAAIVPLVGGGGSLSDSFDRLLESLRLPTTDRGLIALVAALLVLRAIAKYGSTLLAGLMVRRVSVRLQVDLFERYLGVNWETAISLTQGEVQQLLSGQTRRVSEFLGQSVVLLESAIFVAGLSAAALIVSPQATVLAAGLIGVTTVIVTVLGSRIQRHAQEVLRHTKDQSTALLQYARGAHVLRAFGVQGAAVADVRQRAMEREAHMFRAQQKSALANALPDLLFVLALLAVVAVAISAGQDIAAVTAVIALLYRISQYLKRLGGVTALRQRIPDLRDVHRSRVLFDANQTTSKGRAIVPSMPQGAVSFRNVTFRFSQAPRPAVDSLTADIERGELVGVVGSSGGGKSTLVHLLVGLIEPDDGRIELGGHDRDTTELIAFVPQTPFVMRGTVASNIRWFRDLPDERLLDAAMRAGLGPVFDRLPSGLASDVAQEGLTLSGGERQRLALARALAGSPSILVLDEATSALDSESEAAIQTSLDDLRGNVTILAVAHRLSTVMNADRIWVMESGHLIENAPPSELLTTASSRFAHLSAMQGISADD